MYFLIVSVWIFTCLTESKVFDSFVGLVREPIEEDKKSRRIRIENIKFDLPDIRTQRKIVIQLEKTQMKFEDLIK